MKIYLTVTLFIATSVFFWSCSEKDSNDVPTLDQTELLNNIGENLILEGYKNFRATAESLSVSAGTFRDNPSAASLADLREKWIAAYQSWQKVAFYNFGPAETSAILTINYYPADVSLINDNINSGDYNLSTAANTFAKGFPALDYLIFGYAENDDDLIAEFSSNPDAGLYVADVADNIFSLADHVHNLWAPGGSNYLSTFVGNKGTSAGSSLSMLVNSWSSYMETHVRNAKIAIPNGNSMVTDERFGPFPEKSEAPYSEVYTRELLLTANEALRDFYLGKGPEGTDGTGIYDVLVEIKAQNGTLADDYLELFDLAGNQIRTLDGTWSDAILNHGEQVTEIFNTYKAIVALLKVDIVSALSISITYTDNDGD